MQFLVAITTGRRIVQRTAAALARHFQLCGHPRSEITLLINYDPIFERLPPDTFSIPEAVAGAFARVLYLGPRTADRVRDELVSGGLTSDQASLLCQPAGYGCRKNLILMTALREAFDAVLFWDDDEYPVVCGGGPNEPVWYSTDVLNGHKAALSQEADVSFGFWSGFVSPVPQDLPEVLSTGVLAALGNALSITTETFAPDSFLSPYRSVAFVDTPPAAAPVDATRGGKWVSGGNLGVSVSAVRGGRVPPFYTPPGSRSDDTLFSLRLQSACVWRVPAGIFHDCFAQYPQVADGALPRAIRVVSLRDGHVCHRFAAALDAWLASAPLFLHMTRPHSFELDACQVADALNILDSGLAAEYPGLAAALPGGPLGARFQTHLDCLDKRIEDLNIVEREWHRVLRWVPGATIPFYESAAW